MTERITRFVGVHGFASNFHLRQVVWRGIKYRSGEHAYNAAKTRNRRARLRIAAAATPKRAKRMGRRMPLRRGWECARQSIMREILLAKFTQSPDLAAALLATGDALLVEGNTWHDNYWGCCYCPREKCAEPGKNHLGRMLMDLRDELRRQHR